MKSVFSEDDRSTVEVKRNPFDLSFQNNLTMNFGKLYPVFCKEVIPGDGFKIDAKFALNMMPMVFPVQTKLQARLDFYYCRNRALWKDWKDFVYHTKEGLSLPYLGFQNEVQKKLLNSSSLGDYMNIPTQSLISETVNQYLFNNSSLNWQSGYSNGQNLAYTALPSFNTGVSPVSIAQLYNHDGDYTTYSNFLNNYPTTAYNALQCISGSMQVGYAAEDDATFTSRVRGMNIYNERGKHFSDINGYSVINWGDSSVYDGKRYVPYWFVPFTPPTNTESTMISLSFRIPKDLFTNAQTGDIPSPPCFDPVYIHSDGSMYMGTVGRYTMQDPGDGYYYISAQYGSTAEGWSDIVMIGGVMTKFSVSNPEYNFGWSTRAIQSYADRDISNLMQGLFASTADGFAYSFIEGAYVSADPQISSYTAVADFSFSSVMSHNPFLDGAIKISALPFRAYEAIYNCWYRNEKVAPFTVNGDVEYNRFNTDLDGGQDDTPYDFYNHNWEKDFLTTCLPSPQQGEAPLVGVRVNGDDSFVVQIDGVEHTITPVVNGNGVITGVSSVDSDSIPEGALELLQSRINSGFSINDLRAVDSFQRWLETNLRRGYKYRDLIYAHTGERIHFNELDMPEYLGGVSDVINVNKIVNTNGDGNTPLGEFAGLGSLFSGLQNGIDVHCDEHGFIIGIMSVVPVPVYTQLLPKHFLKFNELDFYNKEFQRIGMQPVYYDEVSPNERYNEEVQSGGNVTISDVFGYQRPYYDYMSSQDEAHGLFRGSLRNYVLGRYFDGSPELSEKFIVTDVGQLNNVFPSSYGDGDKILGQIYFDVIAKRPMMRNAVPSL